MKKIAFLALALVVSATVTRTQAQPGDLLQFLPDGNMVIVIDARKITSSPDWSKLSSQNKVKGLLEKAQGETLELGIKLTDIDLAALVFPTASFSDPVVAARGRFNQADIIARIRSDSKVKLTAEKYKEFDVHRVAVVAQTSKGTHGVSFVFYDAGTVVVGTPAGVRASIDARTGAKPAVAQNARFADVIAQNPTAAVRFAMDPKSLTDSLQTNELPLPDFGSIKLIFGTLDLTSTADLNVTLRNDTADNAKAMAERLNGLLGMGRAYLASMSDPKMVTLGNALKTVTITATDIDVKIAGTLPAETLAQVLN
jgi:hypothetical protein